MFFVESLEINGFWGRNKIQVRLSQDANIFIGKNGTGKTTLLNILKAALIADIDTLLSYEFASINIQLKATTPRRSRKIYISRENGSIKYQVGVRKFTIAREFSRRHLSFFLPSLPPRLREELKKLVKVCSITVLRELHEGGSLVEDNEALKHPIDWKIKELTTEMADYFLNLEKEAIKLSDRFQKDVLKSVLYNPQFEKDNRSAYSQYNLSSAKINLEKMYNNFGIFDDVTSKQIDAHVAALETAINARKTKERLNIDDVLPLPLIPRTAHIISLLKKLEEARAKLYKPYYDFIKLQDDFIGKNIKFSFAGKNTCFYVGSKELPLEKLSSGEKQLLIFFMETLLQKRDRFVFIADEPELSLHIDWQEKILPAIKKLNPKAQIIVATHSPEISATYGKNNIDMEEITYGSTSCS